MSQHIIQSGDRIYTESNETRVPSNAFDLSHDSRFSGNMGTLYPATWFEVLPGDRISVDPESLVRFQPMVAPPMQRINCRSYAFFVPLRLLWKNWEKFISPPSTDTVTPAVPFFAQVGSVSPRSLAAMLGVPSGVDLNDRFSALPFAAYQKIWYDWFRDQNIYPNNQFIELYDGNNDTGGGIGFAGWNTLFNVSQDRDYFTSATPWAQKGPSVVIPAITGTANVVLKPGPQVGRFRTDSGDPMPTGTQPMNVIPFGGGSNYGTPAIPTSQLVYDPNSSLGVDVSTSSSGTMIELARAEMLQVFLAKDAIGGTRYIETIETHFGVRSSDERLQRPEYLGSTNQAIAISEVLNTAGGDQPQGTMAGHGISSTNDRYRDYYAEEHGIYMVLCDVKPTTAYYQGLHRSFLRFDRFDYAWPEFANIGMQAILNKEVYYNNDGLNNDVFGYIQRYGEYRTLPNRIAGEFRTSLEFWHLGRKFTSRPVLSSNFTNVQPDDNLRIFAVTDPAVDHVLFHWMFRVKAWRKLPRIPEDQF